MKFDHKVKYNGVWYEPGEDIEEGVGNTASSNFSEFMTPPVENKYTKTEKLEDAEVHKNRDQQNAS